MSIKPTRNFHVPLSEDLYNKLRDESHRSKQPATELVRQAIDLWLQERQRVALHEAITNYATKLAGSTMDLDQDLEAASIEHLLSDKEDTQ